MNSRTQNSTINFHWLRAMLLAFAFTLSVGGASFSAHADTATLNLKDTDIRVFIETVSRLTGKTIIIDPRVKNQQVTVLSQSPMNEQEIWSLFLSVLKVYGYAAVETDGIWKVTQQMLAKTDSTDVVSGDDKYPGDAQVTRVIKVENIDVQKLPPLLRGLVPQQGHLAPYPGSNVLVVQDSAANVERIEKIIKQIDKGSSEDIEVIPLQHASAQEVVRILDNLNKQQPQDQSPMGQPKVVADERTNSLLLGGEPSSRLRLRALIARLDTPLADTGNTKVIYLNYAKATELAELLEGVAESIEQEEGARAPQQRRGGNQKNYSIKAHEDTNALVVTAPPDIMRSFESVIRQLDIRRAQVHVEAIIVEISDTKAKELGVQWLFSQGGSGSQPVGLINFNNTGTPIVGVAGASIANQGQEGTSVTTVAPDGTTTTTTQPGQGDNGAALAQFLSGVAGAAFGLADIDKDGFSWAALIKALGSDTDSNVLSTPSITTLDNEEASISVGQEIPIITGSTLGDGNSNPFQTVDRKDVGVKLKLTPQINEGDAVRLTIEQEVSSIAGTTGADIVTNKRQITTTVLVNDGGMVVLGGLIDDDVQESSQKVPLLGDIPILGHLFKSQRTSKVKRNLMVFIRPSILRDQRSASALSARKYEYMRAQQLDLQAKGISLMPSETSAVLPAWDESLALPPTFEEVMESREADGELETESN